LHTDSLLLSHPRHVVRYAFPHPYVHGCMQPLTIYVASMPRRSFTSSDTFSSLCSGGIVAFEPGEPVQDRPATCVWPHRRRSRNALLSKWYAYISECRQLYSRRRRLSQTLRRLLRFSSTSSRLPIASRSCQGVTAGLGLEMALALVEAGARAVYCVDLPAEPGEEWKAARAYATRLANKRGEGRLEYVSGNVTDQVRTYNLWILFGR
jgi:hypothetical protein